MFTRHLFFKFFVSVLMTLIASIITFSKKKKMEKKNVTLDPRHGTLALDMEPSTLDPRQKDRLGNVVRVLVHFFFTAAHFHLALVAANISHFVAAATKFSCCSSNKKMSPLFFISRSRSLSPFFSSSFAGLPPTFSFSLSFSCSIFQICGHIN